MQERERDTLTTWAEEAGSDRRHTRWAIVAAVILHALFFRLELPRTAAAEVRPPARPVCRLQLTPRFQPPPPREQRLLPRKRVRRVPVPDKTPHEPELPTPVRIELPLTLVDGDIVGNLPATPPAYRPSGPLRVGGDVLPPVKIHAPPPRYTEIARKARIQGAVHLEAIIDATGRVGRIRVTKGLPMGLEQAAVDAVRQWRFEPATYNGKPVAVIYNLTIFFRLTP